MSLLSPFCRVRMTKFRLKMDMSQFFDDERTLVYILVDPKWEQVYRLQEHVEKVFDVPVVHFLTDDGVYLPPKESIDIVRSGDILKAIVPNKIKKKKKKNRSDGIGDEPVEEDFMEIEIEKSKDNGLTSSTPHRQPHKKQKIAVDVTRFVMERSEDLKGRKVSSKIQQTHLMTDTVSSTNNTQEMDKSGIQESVVEPAEVIEETVKSRKRKRVRKKKKPTRNSENETKSPRLSTVPVPISSSTLRLSKSMSTPKKSSQHVHFDENATEVEQNPELIGKRTTRYRCHLNAEGVMRPREIDAEEEEEGATEAKKPRIQIHENIVLVKANNVSKGEEEHNETSVIEVDDSTLRPEAEEEQEEVVESTATEVPVEGPQRTINVEAVLPYSEPLVGFPDVGDIVLFKMYRLDEGSTPGASEYICGRCEEVDETLRTMNCFVLDGHDQIDELSKLTKPDENGETNFISLFLDELLDKRIFRMS